jgi:hypothetical protein
MLTPRDPTDRSVGPIQQEGMVVGEYRYFEINYGQHTNDWFWMDRADPMRTPRGNAVRIMTGSTKAPNRIRDGHKMGHC